MPPEIVAAVDLGSNSFHLVVARAHDRHLQILDRLREPVRLGAGLDKDDNLDEPTQVRALECLMKFGERLRGHPEAKVRAVGTNALRVARNSKKFLTKADSALGHPIEIVAGREEARLIYLGVSHSVPDSLGRRLVVDIGGGSTECILGEGFDPIQTESLQMGCVSWTAKYFPKGEIRREHFKRAELAARREIQTIERQFRALGFETCLGSSGTITSIGDILRESAGTSVGITQDGLRQLKKDLIGFGHIDKIKIEGVRTDRCAVLPGGLAIIRAVVDGLDVSEMLPATGALREGVLYDLLGRMHHEDGREPSIRRFSERYQVDKEQAARVERTALFALRQVAKTWKLDDSVSKQILAWAARTHEAGMLVSYSGYQKHGAYLIANTDLAGFSRDEQTELASLVRGHRRRLSEETWLDVDSRRREPIIHLCLLLRLAVVLNRARAPRPLPAFALKADGEALKLVFPDDWLDHHALIRADLEDEIDAFATVGVTFSFR